MERDGLDVPGSQAALYTETPLQQVVYDLPIFETVNIGMSI